MLLCGLHCESKHTEVSSMLLRHLYKKVGGGKSRKKDVCAGLCDTGTPECSSDGRTDSADHGAGRGSMLRAFFKLSELPQKHTWSLHG